MSFKVFVFEDNKEMVDLLREILRLKGDMLHEFIPGETINSQVLAARPDVILVDLRMNPPGHEIVKTLKSDAALAGIPVLLFTASNIKPAEVKAMGVQGIIHKPFSLDEIEKSIDKAILKRSGSSVARS